MRPPVGVAVICFAALSFVTEARAQGFYWSLAYEPSVPVGSVRTATSEPSGSGASLGVRYLFTDHWSLGLGGRWNRFAQNFSVATYPLDNGAIHAAAFRQVSVGSALAEAHFYLSPNALFNPYMGLGTGVSWMDNKLLVSDFTFDDRSAGFTLSPEAGILIAFDRDVFDQRTTAMQSAMIGVRYTHTTAGSRDVSSVAFFGLTLGVLIY